MPTVYRWKRHCNNYGCGRTVCQECPSCCGSQPFNPVFNINLVRNLFFTNFYLSLKNCCSAPRPSPSCCPYVPPMPSIPPPSNNCCGSLQPASCCQLSAPTPCCKPPSPPAISPVICCKNAPVPENPCCQAIAEVIPPAPASPACCAAAPVPANPCCQPAPKPAPCNCVAPRPVPCRCGAPPIPSECPNCDFPPVRLDHIKLELVFFQTSKNPKNSVFI